VFCLFLCFNSLKFTFAFGGRNTIYFTLNKSVVFENNKVRTIKIQSYFAYVFLGILRSISKSAIRNTFFQKLDNVGQLFRMQRCHIVSFHNWSWLCVLYGKFAKRWSVLKPPTSVTWKWGSLIRRSGNWKSNWLLFDKWFFIISDIFIIFYFNTIFSWLIWSK